MIQNMIDILEKEKCTGCGACFAACPVGCISMIADENGFEYPRVSESCINCGKCSNVCPALSGKPRLSNAVEHKAFALCSKDPDVYVHSSSGGAFTEICSAFANDDTVIFGAAFDGFKVIHTGVEGVENIAPLRKSKYVAASAGDCFRQTKALLEQGRRVVWCSTPCRISGLRSFLGHEYDNLLCVDFICHGVGSPKVFEDFINYTQECYGEKLRKYTFRSKRKCDKNVSRYMSEYEFESGRKMYIDMDEYSQIFIDQLCLRDCCEGNCDYQTEERVSDITIADFNSRHKALPEIAWDYRAYSTLIVNTEKGQEVFEKLRSKVDCRQCAVEEIKKYNFLFCKKAPGNPRYKQFFEDYRNNEFSAVINKYAKPKKESRIKLFTNRMILKYYIIELAKIVYSRLKRLIKR